MIGQGSYAHVRRAKHRGSGEYVAVKIVSKKKMNIEDLQALETEIELMKQIDHPNIIKLYDVYEDKSHICLVMELMSGGELFEKIMACDQFPENDTREVIK